MQKKNEANKEKNKNKEKTFKRALKHPRWNDVRDSLSLISDTSTV